MSDEHRTPITQEEWRGLQKGKGIKDAHGRVWEVIGKDSGNPDLLTARCPGHPADDLIWHESQILEKDEWAVIIELNHSSVTIV
ncbi:MAG: hypothetical protein Q8K92_02690 [Leadbetterella sp.]|nr:hypothetical protein [Leadbetterella sp.]